MNNNDKDYGVNDYNENNGYHIQNNNEYDTNRYGVNNQSFGQQSGQINSYEEPTDLKEASFYTENYAKSKKKKMGILGQMIAVSLISSIIGGVTVGAFMQFGDSLISPSVQSMLNDAGIKTSEGTASTLNDSEINTGSIKKVVIENSDSTSAVVSIAEKVGPSVVGISVEYTTQNYFFGAQEESSSGSGIVIRSDGYIMTNNHVISSAMQSTTKLMTGAKIEVILPNEIDKPYTATVVGRDESTDLAVLKIQAADLPTVEMGDSDTIKIGELAVAIGNPGGLEYMGSVTVGVISGLNRSIPLDESNALKLIQTDAAINPGNSGGALVNSEGKLIGINTAKISGTGFEGLGFAIPVNRAKEITDSLIELEYVKKPSIGVVINSSFNEQVAERYNVPAGVLVEEVAPLSGAYKAGVKRGDIITKVDGIAVKTFTELNDLKNKHQVGETLKLEVYRDDVTLTLDVVLEEDDS